MAKKWLQKLDALAKKGSNAGGKLGLISRAVDSIIPDANPQDAKNAKALGDTNSGGTDTPASANASATAAAAAVTAAAAAEKPTMAQKWGSMPTWAKGSIIAAIAGLVVVLIKSMGKKKGYSRR